MEKVDKKLIALIKQNLRHKLQGIQFMNRISLRIHCDFCNTHGHNVNNCRNPELNQIENELYCEKEKILADENDNHIIHLCAKINSIFGTNLTKLKAYAMIKCKYRQQRRQPDFHEYIANYIYENEMHTNVNVSISHNYIPFHENDAVQYLIDINEMVLEEPSRNVQWIVVKEMHLDSNECSICYENFPSSTFAQIDCNHTFCVTCVKNLTKCALCRSPIKTIKTLY